MKKWIAGMLALVMLLLPGCQNIQQSPTEDTAKNPTENTAKNATENTTENTTKRFIPPPLTAEECLIERQPLSYPLTAEECLIERQPLSYEEFKNRIISEDGFERHTGGGNKWLIPKGDDYLLFKAKYEKGTGITVYSDAYKATYTVPGSETLPECDYLMQSDGKWAYLKCPDQFLQVDMYTGNTVSLVQFDECITQTFCGRDVLYYAAIQDGVFGVYRLYIPTGERTVLYDKIPVDMPRAQISFFFVDSPGPQGEITWKTLNPVMWEMAKEEMANPNSRYKDDEMVKKLWDSEASLTYDHYVYLVERLMQLLQNDTGVHALLKGIYDQKTETYTEKTGILDGCWFNMNFHVDHFSPEITEKDPPVLDLGEWMPIPGLTPMEEAEAEKMYAGDDGKYPYTPSVYSDSLSPNLMYREDAGRFILLDEVLACKTYTLSEEYYILTTDYIYYVSGDNALCRLSYDGKVRQTLYEAKYGTIQQVKYTYGMVCFVDGDTAVLMDIPAARYRTVLTYEGIVDLWVWDGGNEKILYMGAGEGMFCIGAHFYLTSEKFEVTTFIP